jgi:hypothetical protein
VPCPNARLDHKWYGTILSTKSAGEFIAIYIGSRKGEEGVKATNYPEIRFFSVAAHSAYHDTDTPEGTWKVVSPETADRVSAVAYYFARKIQQQTHVPIGLVVDALGGTPAEAWTSAEALRPLRGPPAILRYDMAGA